MVLTNSMMKGKRIDMMIEVWKLPGDCRKAWLMKGICCGFSVYFFITFKFSSLVKICS